MGNDRTVEARRRLVVCCLTYTVFGSSVTGESHLIYGKGGDDSYGYKIKGNYIIAVVADGAGSASLSKIGSELVVQAFLDQFEKSETIDDLAGFLKDTVDFAREEIVMKSIEGISPDGPKPKESKGTIKDYATTVAVFLSNGKEWCTAHIGDGAIVISVDNEIKIAAQPYRSEYVNETVFITSDNYKELLDIRTGDSFDKVFLFTDGIQRGVLEPDGETMKPFLPFFQYLSEFSDNVKGEEKGSSEIEKLLLSDQIKSISDDDKTLLILVKRYE